MKMLKTIIFTYFALVFSFAASGQGSEWKWPEDEDLKAKVQEKIVLYTDFLKVKNYTAAKPHLDWLIANVPDLNVSLYINGAKIYDNVMDKESDEARKFRLQDSVIWMYDQRIKYFNEKEKVTNYKAMQSMAYYQNRKERYEDLYNTLQEAIELNGNDVFEQNLYYYMIAVNKYKINSGNLTDEDVIEKYFTVMDILNHKIEKAPDPAPIEALKEKTTDIFVRTVDLNCDLIQDGFGNKLKENPDDIGLAKNTMTLMIAGKCTDNPLFLETAIKVFEVEPTYALAKVIAIKMRSADNLDEAIKYYEKAIELTDENLKQAEIYFDIAKLLRAEGRKSEARSYAYKASSADPSMRSEALSFIGDLYYSSFNSCANKTDLIKDYSVFCAAYDKYKAAGDSQGMSKSSKMFLSAGDVHQSVYSAGQSIQVGCWIGETTQIYVKKDQ